MFDQSPYQCRVEWGPRGAREAAARGDIVIVVDVLSFSTTVVTAVHHGAEIFPYPPPKNEQALAYAAQVGAEFLYGRAEAARLNVPSLSPVSFGPQHAGNKYVLCSLNGAVCSWVAGVVPALLIGSLLNASAVAQQANRLHAQTGAAITVIPCGERWENLQAGDNELRPGIEDYLGAGAILAGLTGSLSPEAHVCVGAFEQAKPRLAEWLWECGSGRELREKGFGADVTHASQLDAYATVPMLIENRFVQA